MTMASRAREASGWRLWVSSTGRHRAIRRGIRTAAQIAAGATVRAQGMRATGPSGGVFASELLQQDRGQATVFIPVPGRVRPIGRVTPLVVPAAELAIISHHGSLADADLSYAKLGSWTITHEISIDGPLREYYLRGAGDTPGEADWRTEIGWPIFRADAARADGS